MKKARLIKLCISCVILITALVVGLAFPPKSINIEQFTPNEQTNIELPSLPDRVPEISRGKYYCVAGTHDSLYIPREPEVIVTSPLPSITIGSDNLCVYSSGNDITGHYQYDGESTISFTKDDIDKILPLYSLDLQYTSPPEDEDEDNEDNTTPTTQPVELIFSCTYDKSEQILYFTYGGNTLTLKRFTSNAEATQWYEKHAIDGMFTFLPNYNDYQ